MSGYRTRQDGSYQPPVVGRETQIGYAPPQPNQVSTPSKSYNYNRGLPEIEGEKVGQGVRRDIKSAVNTAVRYGVQAELLQYGVTGSVRPGFHNDNTGGFPAGKTIGGDPGDGLGGVPKRRYSNNDIDDMLDRGIATGRARAAAQSGAKGTEKAHHRIEPRQLMAGPRVHSVGSQAELPPAGNPLNAKTSRALGPGPAPQFSNELSAEIGQGVHALGGKRIGPEKTLDDRFMSPGERVSQPRNQRRAGGNISGGIRDYSGEGSSELFGGGKPMPPAK